VKKLIHRDGEWEAKECERRPQDTAHIVAKVSDRDLFMFQTNTKYDFASSHYKPAFSVPLQTPQWEKRNRKAVKNGQNLDRQGNAFSAWRISAKSFFGRILHTSRLKLASIQTKKLVFDTQNYTCAECHTAPIFSDCVGATTLPILFRFAWFSHGPPRPPPQMFQNVLNSQFNVQRMVFY